jgi:hypothetical protein
MSGREGLVMCWERDGSLITRADLRSLSDKVWNEIIVDSRGHAYINGAFGIVLSFLMSLYARLPTASHFRMG